MPITLDEAQEELANSVQLTERWTPLRPHEMQSRLIYHPAQFKWVPPGRRSGKTELAKRDTVKDLLIDYGGGSAARMIVGAPTYTRVKDIYWQDMLDLIPKSWVKRAKESTNELEIKTHWNAVIRFVGMNNPQVVEGVPWNRGKFDELADYPPNTFEKHILPAFNTEGVDASAWMIGVPDEEGTNQKEYEKYFDRGLKWPLYKRHCSFWWPSSDILSNDKIEEMAEGMDPMRFQQELLGLFVRSGGKAFPTFNQLHVDAEYAAYSAFIPVEHSLDFGVRPAASLIVQHYKSQAWVLDEILLSDGSTDVAAETFLHRCGQRGYDLYNGINVYGDAAGRTPGQNIGKSDYEILKTIYAPYNPKFLNLMYNPERKDTVNAIRSRLADHNGRITLFIHPRCERLIDELKSAPWPDKLEKFHCLAALRYFIYSLSGQGQVNAGITGTSRATITENQRLSAKYTR